MNGWLLDTNVIAALISPTGAPSVKTWARSVAEHDLYISVLTLAEYDKGIANLPNGDPNAARYAATRDALEARFWGRVLPLSDPVVRCWGEISGRVKRDIGHPPPVMDTLLAATAIEARFYLVSRNVRDFKFSGVNLFDPWKDDPAAFSLARTS